jgi:hypothetical protein
VDAGAKRLRRVEDSVVFLEDGNRLIKPGSSVIRTWGLHDSITFIYSLL